MTNSISASQLLFPLYSLAHLAIVIWLGRRMRIHHCPGAIVVVLICSGLVYDNLIISIGATVGVGQTLEFLSWPRFALHAWLTPFSIVALMHMGSAAGVEWVSRAVLVNVAWVAAIALAIYGSLTHLIGLDLYPACYQGILRYSSAVSPNQLCFADQPVVAGSGPPIPSILTGLMSLIMGFVIWRQTRWPWLLAGAVAMFFAASVPTSVYGTVYGNGGEVLLLASYALTSSRFSTMAPRAATDENTS